VFTKVSEDEKEITLISILCETDFVARTDEFVNLGKSLVGPLSESLPETNTAKPFPEDTASTVKEKVTDAVAKMGENIQFGDYSKFVLKNAGKFYFYIHHNQKIGVALELGSDKIDEKLDKLGKDICLHIAAFSPEFVTPSEIPEETLKRERDIYIDQMKDTKKPEAVLSKIVEGKIEKFYEDKCLLNQKFALDTEKNNFFND